MLRFSTFVALLAFVPWLPTYRLEGMANDQSRTLDLEREKRLVATRTLKNSEADLLKAREDLKEVTRARDSAESSLASA